MERDKRNIKLARAVYIVALLGLLVYLGSILQPVIAPLVLSIILSLVILPLANGLEKIGFNRLFSGLTLVVVIALLILGVGFVGVIQLRDLGSSFGNIEQTFFSKLNRVVDHLPPSFQPPRLREIEDIEKILPDDLGLLGSFFGDALKLTGGVLSTLTLIPIFVFFILFYRRKISHFLEWVDSKGSGELTLATKESKKMVQSYLSGMGLVILINASLATGGLWAIGISYALLLGILSALLTVIPYIGTFVGALIPIAFAFLTKDSLAYGFGVMALYIIIQFIENNFISPVVLGNSVNVNPFASVLALLVMGHYWGVIGMLVAVPLTAVIVILFDHSKMLKPLNLLLKNDNE
ncbi:MAG TPA: AI-2E family transporter [Cryomorphaceae bacterium]|nr:AI-2E family transporter [Cryomorphaceae bacterium]